MSEWSNLRKQWDARYAFEHSAIQSGITVALCPLIQYSRHEPVNQGTSSLALSTPEIGVREPLALYR